MKIFSWINKHIEELLLSISLITFVIVMGLQVFMRYVVNQSLAWPEELSRYIFIWFTFIGVSYAIRTRSHLRIDILQSYLSKKALNVLETVVDIVFIIFSVIVVIAGFSIFNTFLETMQTSPGLGIPFAFVYLSLPIGFGLSIIRLIQNIVNRIRGKEIESEEIII